MKQTDIRSHCRFLKASSILGAAAAFNPAAIRFAFATSNITTEEEIYDRNYCCTRKRLHNN
jgi:hypothetical protein